MRDFIDLLITAMLFFGCATIYYLTVVQPRDEILYEVIDCMGDDLSREAYQLCYIHHPSRNSDDRAPPG